MKETASSLQKKSERAIENTEPFYEMNESFSMMRAQRQMVNLMSDEHSYRPAVDPISEELARRRYHNRDGANVVWKSLHVRTERF